MDFVKMTYDENMFLLADICITWHINIKYYILFYLINHFIINVYFYCTIGLKIFWVRISDNNNMKCMCFSLLLSMNELSRTGLKLQEQRRAEQRLTNNLHTKTKAALLKCNQLTKWADMHIRDEFNPIKHR